MTPPVRLVRLTVRDKATQKNVTGEKTWVAVKQGKGASLFVEASTAPLNNAAEWAQIKWSGDGAPVPGAPNRRLLSLATSQRLIVQAALGGASDTVDLWVLWATVEVQTKGSRPLNAASFAPGTRDGTNQLGAVTYKSVSSSVIDEKAGIFVDNMGASGKVCPVATLTPPGVNAVVKAGLTFERQVISHNWSDGIKTKQFNDTWTRDTSDAAYLKLIPDAKDKLYDLDGPDLRWGQRSYETYNNFRQWITFNTERCSDYGLWHWQARWQLHRDPAKQITLNEVGPGSVSLPDKPALAKSP
jgi:hypothetical protein